MNLNNFTIKAQQAVAAAQQIAFNQQNPSIETEHLLKALLDEDDSPLEYLLKKSNVNINYVETKLTDALDKLPKSSAGEPAQALGRDLNGVLLKTGSYLKDFGDEFVSNEHLLLALLEGKDTTAHILRDAGLNKKDLVASINDLRKGSTVNSQTQGRLLMRCTNMPRT